ncbi:MAG: AraC family transcriptional regulator [Anaerolineae bacterium]
MLFNFDERPSDSPLIEKIWRTHSERPGSFISLAASNCEIVVMKYRGKTTVTVRGPETKASVADCPADAEFFGIVFKLGTYMPHFPAVDLIDHNDYSLPQAGSKSFWLNGSAWELPTFDNADVFVNRLVRRELLLHDDVVDTVLQERPLWLSLRSARRRFIRATGLTHSTIRQIERARQALILLQQGRSILDTVYEVGYFDQPHMTRALRLYTGKTPAQIVTTNYADPTSLLFNT